MLTARKHYEAAKFVVVDVSKSQPYDLVCTRGEEVIRVEVKGTRDGGGQVRLTIAEVRNARESGVRTDLFVVSPIGVTDVGTKMNCTEGRSHALESWTPREEHLAVTDYRYRVPPV